MKVERLQPEEIAELARMRLERDLQAQRIGAAVYQAFAILLDARSIIAASMAREAAFKSEALQRHGFPAGVHVDIEMATGIMTPTTRKG